MESTEAQLLLGQQAPPPPSAIAEGMPGRISQDVGVSYLIESSTAFGSREIVREENNDERQYGTLVMKPALN